MQESMSLKYSDRPTILKEGKEGGGPSSASLFFSLLFSSLFRSLSLELSDARVYEHQILEFRC